MLARNGNELRLRPKSFDVLVYLVEHRGRIVPRAELLDAIWGKTVVTDDSVTQCLIEIRKSLGDGGQEVIRTVPRKGYVFERPVEKISRGETPHLRRRPTAQAAGRTVLFVAAFAIAGLAGVAGWQWFHSDAPADAQSVAVLPFIDMSAAADHEYLGDGIAETLLHTLAQVPELKVAARTSSFAFKGKDVDIRTIGDKLGVVHVLEGSVRREGNQLRVTAQLVRAADGFHIWSETYDRELTEVFSIQDEIASAVGVRLLATFLNPVRGSERRAPGTRNFEAYDAYLRGMAEARKASYTSLQAAEGLLNEALDHDPRFIDAKAELAELIMTQADTGMRTYAEGLALHRELALEVLAVDPLHPKAGSTLLASEAMMATNDGDLTAWREAVPRLREIIAAAPNQVDAKIWLGFLLGRFGDREEAVRVLEDVLDTDPLNLLVHEFLAQTLTRLRRYEAAQEVLLRAADIDPEAPNTWKELGQVALRLGDAELALDSFLRAHASDPADVEHIGQAAEFLYLIGLPEEARALQQYVAEIDADSAVAQNLALLDSWARGEKQIAVDLARRILDRGLPERWIAWPTAMRILAYTSAQRGSVAEDIRLFEKHMPEFSKLDNVDVPWTTNTARMHALDALATIYAPDRIRQYGDAYFRNLERMNVSIRNAAHLHVSWLLCIGETEAAVQVALDDLFSRPATMLPMWRLLISRPIMSEWAEDPSIQAAVRRLEKEESEMRVAVQRYLAQRGAGQAALTAVP